MNQAEYQRNYSLDVLRVIATVLIVFHHYQQATGAFFEGYLNFFNGRFYFGYIVEFFFLLSGFFMVNYRNWIENGGAFKGFLKKRVTRLLPLVLVSGITYEFFLYWYQRICQQDWFGIKINIWGVIIDAIGVQDGWAFANPCVNNPTWYISVLILCYVIFYFLTYIANRLRINSDYLYIFMIFLGCGIQAWNINLPFLNGSTARGFFAFFGGLMLSEWLKKHKINIYDVILSFFVIGLMTYFMLVHWEWVGGNIQYLMTFCYYPALIILFSTKPMEKLFQHPTIGFLGKVTYDVYIWHNPNFLLMYVLMNLMNKNYNLNSIKAMVLYTFLCFVAGTLSYFCLEKPINNKLIALRSDP